MSVSSTDRRLGLVAFLLALIAVVPLLWTEQAPGADDAIAARAGATIEAKLARNIAGLYYDDGFYYLQIARHLAAGSGSTFDGLHPTNGYHPLWLLILVPLAWLFEPDRLLLVSFALQVLAAGATAVLVYRIARLLATPVAALLAVTVWVRIQCTYWMSWAGMEYGLQALVVVALIYVYLARGTGGEAPTLRSTATLGALACLAFLARLDNVLLGALVGFALVWRGGRGIAWRTLVTFFAPMGLAAAVYGGLNLWIFDQPGPVSAGVKEVWSEEHLEQDPRYLEHGWLAAKAPYLLWPLSHLSRSYALSLLLGAFGGVAWVAFTASREVGRLWPLAAFSVLQYLAYAALYHGGFSFQPWYFVAQPLVVALAAATACEWVWRRAGAVAPWGPRLRPWGVALALAVLAASTALNIVRRHQRLSLYSAEPLYAAAGWSRANLPAGAIVGAWNSGILAFFSDRSVVNLDGLVNSRDYFLVGRHDLCAYFEQTGIRYLVDVFDDALPFAQYDAELGQCSAAFERVWTGPAYPDSPRRAIVFKRRAGDGSAG